MENANFKKVNWVLWVILAANLGVAFLKIIIGSSIKSQSLTADGFHSLSDGSSNIVGLIGIHLAAKPVDEDHPYGHQKYETLAGLFIAGMLLVLGVKIVIGAIAGFTKPVMPETTVASLAVLLVTLGVNIWVSIYEYGQGKKLNSDILVSDSLHTRSDIFVSLGVLASLAGMKLGLPAIIDPVASLIVAGFIFYAAVEILLPTCGVLSDKAVLNEKVVLEVASSFEQVKNVHKIRSRGRRDTIYLDLHVMIDPGISVAESHDLVHALETKIGERVGGAVHTIVHVEPFFEKNELPLSEVQ